MKGRQQQQSSSLSSSGESPIKKTQRGLRSKSKTTEEPSPPRPRTSGLSGTKFRPNTSRNPETGPGAHHGAPEPLEDRYMASAPPTQTSSKDEIPQVEVEVAVAELVTEAPSFDEEAIRQQAEQDAENRLMKNVPRAEVVTENGSAKKRSWLMVCILFFILTVSAVVVAVAVTRKDQEPVRITLAPSTRITLAPTPTLSPTGLPSTMPSEPFTNDFCQGARELDEETTLWLSSTTDATLDEGFATCGDVRNNGRGQWLLVRGENAWLRVHTCNEATNYDTQLSVYRDEGLGKGASSCLSSTCVAGNDQFCGDQSFVQWFGEQDTLYRVLVHGYRHYTGDFALELDVEKNEVCEGALNTSQTIFRQTRGKSIIKSSMARAAPIDSERLPQCRFGSKPSGVGIWFSYDGKYNYPNLSVGNGLSLAIYGGSCERLSCVAFEGEKLVDEEGETYFVLVYYNSKDVSQEPFQLNIEWGAQFSQFRPPQLNTICETVQGNPELMLSPGEALRGETFSDPGLLLSQPFSDLGSCGDSVFFTSDGLWYSVLGTGRPMTVSTCRNHTDAGSSRMEDFDTQISVFEGSCDNLRCIDGNDQYCGDQSAVSWFTEEGMEYLVLLHGYGTRYGAFEVSYNEIGTFGEESDCQNSMLIIPDGTSILGNATWNEPSNPIGYCGFGGSTSEGAGSWFKTVGTGQTWTASTCSSTTDFPARVSVYEGTSCSDLVCLDNAESSPCGDQNAVTWETTTDKVYYILVHGKDPGSQGSFVLTLEETASNDRCEGAIGPLNPDGVTNFASTRSATFDDTLPSCSKASDGGRAPVGRGIFYSVLGTGTNLTASTCLSYTSFDAQISVFGGSCNDLQCLDVQTEPCSINESSADQLQGTSVTWEAARDELYFLLIQGTDEETGNFAFQVHTNDIANE